MTQDQLRVLWTGVGFALVSYALAAWVNSQGGTFVTDAVLIETAPVAAELIAAFVCAALLALEAEIGRRHARRAGAVPWHRRIPVVATDTLRLGGLDTGSSEGKCYQSFWGFVFIVLPLGGLGHFVNTVADVVVIDKSAPEREMNVLSGIAPARVFSGPYWDDAFRIGENGGRKAGDMAGTVTWFPVLEPILLALLISFALVQVVRFALVLFTRRSANVSTRL